MQMVGAGGSVSSTMGSRETIRVGARLGQRGRPRGVAYILISTESPRKVVHLPRLEQLQELNRE